MSLNNADLWNKVLLKNCDASEFNNTLTISSNKKKYQIFEVLVTETLARLYSDFNWTTSPVQHDGGVDFVAEKGINKSDNYFPHLLIYGQVKRRNTNISEKTVVDATNNIIRYYKKNAMQEKCLYEIIHVFSTDKNIIKEIKKTIENIDSLHYCVRIINAEFLFKIWCLNKEFIHSIIDCALTVEEKNILDYHIEKNIYSWDNIFTFKKNISNNISVGQIFECIIEIDLSIDISYCVEVKWIPVEKEEILLISPQELLNSRLLIVKSINNKITLGINFLANSVGTYDLGELQFISPFGQTIYKMQLGQINVSQKFNPSFCESPIASIIKMFRNVLDEHTQNPNFYVVTGEGGIGKSKLLENVRIFAINNKYRSVNIEHICNSEDDRNIIFELIIFLCKCDNKVAGKDLYPYIRRMFGGLYRQEWNDDLLNFLYGDVVKNDDKIIECIFHLMLLTLENDSLCITFSNMHWATTFLLSTLKMLIEYINDSKYYLKNNLIIIFEGRSNEKIYANYRNIIPYDWIEFCNYNILKKVELKKWSCDDSKTYIRALFAQPQTSIEYFDFNNIQKILLKYSNGNPMHINEMIKQMISQRALTLDNIGQIHILAADMPNKFSTEILDVVRLRIQYFTEKYPHIMDYLVIFANLIQDDYVIYSVFLNEKLCEMNFDSMSFFNESGFIEQKNEVYYFTHEHYKTILMQQSIYDFNIIENLWDYLKKSKRTISNISQIRLLLLKEEKDDVYWESVFDETLRYLMSSKKAFEQYSLLQFLEVIPSHILQKKGYPLYKIYRFLIDGAMVISNYNEAIKYIKKISDITDLNEDYYLNLIYAKKMLSNIDGLQMKMDNAITESLDFIENINEYIKKNSFKTNEIYKERILFYDRVAIEYYMAGQYEKCEEYHKSAKNMLEEFDDQYVKYHILYEQGVRELHNNITEGIRHIEDSLEKIPINDYMTESQEKDLILGNLLMGKLLETKNIKKINNIKKYAMEKCDKLEMHIEPFESILFHWIVGICLILQKDFKEAIRYFKRSVIISAKTPIEGMLWKSYLNLAQAYLLFGYLANNNHQKSYIESAIYYIMEAKQIITDALEYNVWTKNDFKKRLSYPMSLIDYLLGYSKEKDIKFKNESALHVDFDKYSFFMLD